MKWVFLVQTAEYEQFHIVRPNIRNEFNTLIF